MEKKSDSVGSDLSDLKDLQVPLSGVEGDIGLQSVVEPLRSISDDIEALRSESTSDDKPPAPELITPYPKWSKKELRELHRKPPRKRPKKTGRKRLRYWARKKKIREKMQKHYQNNKKWRIMGFTHWEKLKYKCTSKKWKLELTEKDLEEMVPTIDDMAGIRITRINREVTVLNRYTVDIWDKDGRILYSGLEARMRDLGYIL